MFMFEDFDNEQEVIDYAKGLFNNPAEIAGLLNKCKLSYSVRIWDNSLIACGLDLIQAAIAKVQQKDCPVEVYNYYKKKECIGKKMFTDYLSVENEQQAQDRLIGSSLLNQDFFWTFLNLVYFALVLLDDNLWRRFCVCATLKKHTVAIGLSGRFEKYQEILPNYLTYFSNNAFYISPITGEIKRLKINRKVNKDGFIVGIETVKDNGWKIYRIVFESGFSVDVARESEFFEVEWLNDTELVDCTYDCKSGEIKQAERQHKKFYNAGWLNVSLGKDKEGHYNHIRAHALVALCYYSWDVCKWGLMNGNSILTIDHKDGNRSHNAIENLQMLTRRQNAQKETNNDGFYFDYFSYFEKVINVCKLQTKEHEDWLKRCA